MTTPKIVAEKSSRVCDGFAPKALVTLCYKEVRSASPSGRARLRREASRVSCPGSAGSSGRRALDLGVEVERPRRPTGGRVGLASAGPDRARPRPSRRDGRPGRRDPRPRAPRGASSSGSSGDRPGTTSAGCRRPRGRTTTPIRSWRRPISSVSLHRLLDPVDRDDDVLGDDPAAAGEHRERQPGAPAPERVDALAVARGVDADRALAGGLDQLGRDALRLVARAVGLGEQHEPGAVGHRRPGTTRRRTRASRRRARRAPRRRSRCPTTRSSAAHPSAVPRWKIATGSTASGAGSSLSHAAVTIPSVPSDPTSSRFRS